ncbi:MAG: hypothetical protein ACFFB5_14385 [Promethearchaeota archaeon]
MVGDVGNKKENVDAARTKFQTFFISTGLSCLIICILLLISTVFMRNFNEFFITTLMSAILFGFALFFEWHGYYLLPKGSDVKRAFFGNPLLFQVIRIIYSVPYLLLCYNGLIIAGGFNINLFIVFFLLFFPYVISRATWRWTRLQNWLRSLDTF